VSGFRVASGHQFFFHACDAGFEIVSGFGNIPS
jgi:hypothetical protein